MGEGKRCHEPRVDLWGQDVDAIAEPRVRSAGVADHRSKSNEARAVASMHMWLPIRLPTTVRERGSADDLNGAWDYVGPGYSMNRAT